MAEHSPPTLNIDTLNRSQSNISIKSSATIDSNRSTADSWTSSTSSNKRRGVVGKLTNGFQSVFRRFSKAHTSLTEMQIQILLTKTNFNREQILQWHERFLVDCPNGYMSRKQFVTMYKLLCPKGDGERFARHVFRAFDLNKSNTVDFNEFLIGLSMTSTTSSVEKKLEWTFQVFDIDGDGLLTRRECLEVIESIVRFNQSLHGDALNPNIDQIVNSSKRSMMKIFDHVKNNRTDQLTMSQFVQGCLKDEFISQLLAPTTTTDDSALINTS